MKNYKIIAIFWGLCLLLLSSPAAAGPEALGMARLKQRGRQLKSQARALKAQYNGLKMKQNNLEQERARLATRAAKVRHRKDQELRELRKTGRKLDALYDYPTWDEKKEMKYSLAWDLSWKWIKDLEADLKKINNRRKQIQVDINGIQQQKNKIRIQYKQIKAEYNRTKSQYYNLKKRVENRRRQQRAGRVRAPTVGRRPTTSPPPSSKKSGHGFSIQY